MKAVRITHRTSHTGGKEPASKRTRRGLAAIEFAVCVPVIVLVTIGAIQSTDAIYLKNSLRIVAYEAAREAIQDGATTAQAQTRANEVLTARGVNNATVTFNPSDITSLVSGTNITVEVSAPANSNTIMPNWFFTGRNIRSSLTMIRE